MKIIVEAVDGKEYELKNISELNFTQTFGIACDSLWIRCRDNNLFDEIISVKAYDHNELIFNGYCDNQKIKSDDYGIELYLFARSSAAILVDNEAEPFTYNKPTAMQLWLNIAGGFGFSYDLPNIKSDDKYEVQKGTSCYGAINQFVSMTADAQICVTPYNSIKLIEKSKNVISLNKYNILSAEAIINRSEPLSEICFKRSSASAGYKMHTKADLYKDLKLNERKQYVNLSVLPQWQREYAISKVLKRSYANYMVLEITAFGYVSENLYQRFSYTAEIGDYKDYLLTEKKYIRDEKGERTRLTLKKEMDIKEITYVD